MPNWSGGILTTKGLALQAKVDAGIVKLALTKMKVGSGVLADGQNIQSMTDLISPQIVVPISAVSTKDNMATITGVITNKGLLAGFHMREMGVFAQDPDVGEILYSINIDTDPSYLPPEGGTMAVSNEFNYHIAASNATNVTANISMNGLVTVEMLEQHTKRTDNPHSVTPAQIGAETPSGAQAKADAAKADANKYTDSKIPTKPEQVGAVGSDEPRLNGLDLNTIRKTGFYSGYNALNGPPTAGNSWVFLIHRQSAQGDVIIQTAWDGINGCHMYTRGSVDYGKTWSEWSSGSAFMSDIPKSLPANGGNADTIGGKSASDFMPANGTASPNLFLSPRNKDRAFYAGDWTKQGLWGIGSIGDKMVIGICDGEGKWNDYNQSMTLLLGGKEVATTDIVPPGTIIFTARNSAPDRYLKANGAAVSRTAYADLFAAIGTTFGAGDGSTTFNLPDLRGEFVRCWDDGRGVDSGRVFGSWQDMMIQSHDHDILYGGTVVQGNSGLADTGNFVPTSPRKYIKPTGGVETRPRNTALLACIKY